MKKNILILNGSITGSLGNTNEIIKKCCAYFDSHQIESEILHLKEINHSLEELKHKIQKADGLLFTTGTYWDSWGSPLQKFLEDITPLESTAYLLFKPCAIIVTMHAFGGKSILSRLQGVLNTMGFLIPPMSGMVYGLAIQEALKKNDHFAKDFWSIDDLEIILSNLLTATHFKTVDPSKSFIAWPVDRKDPTRRWITCENE